MNRYLLDTHAFIWWVQDSPRLGVKSFGIISDANNDIYVSAASVWEISIKQQLGKLKIPEISMSDVIEDEGFLPLSMSIFHSEKAGGLPLHHKDPFDRMLAAQAQIEGLVLITKDEIITQYGIQTVNALK